MGVSTNAYLFWGLCGGDEGHWVNLGREYGDGGYVEDTEGLDEQGDWEDIYAARMGLESPGPYDEHKDEYPAYWDAKRKLVEESGCEINWHCSGEYAMPFVAVSESLTRAARGDPAKVEPREAKPEWEAKLRRFCEVMGVKWSEPGWWLASYWG